MPIYRPYIDGHLTYSPLRTVQVLFAVVIVISYTLQDEKRKLEEERDSAKKQVDLLCGDLEVTQTESTKETKKWEVG